MERSPKPRRGKRSTSSGMRQWTRTRGGLRVVRLVAAGYLLSMLAAKIFVDSGVGKLPSIGLRLKDINVPHRLRLRTRRRHEGRSCKGYGVDDPYFLAYGGEYCGLMSYVARPSGDATEVHDIQKINLVYNAFASTEHASEYFWRFWGIHAQSIMPTSYMVDVSAKFETIGDEHRALYFNPGLLMQSTGEDKYRAAHLIYCFRVGQTVIILSASGFPHQDATSIDPQLMKSMASSVKSRISYSWKSTTRIRKSAVSVLKFGRRLESYVNGGIYVFEKWANNVDAQLKTIDTNIKEWSIPNDLSVQATEPLIDSRLDEVGEGVVAQQRGAPVIDSGCIGGIDTCEDQSAFALHEERLAKFGENLWKDKPSIDSNSGSLLEKDGSVSELNSEEDMYDDDYDVWEQSETVYERDWNRTLRESTIQEVAVEPPVVLSEAVQSQLQRPSRPVHTEKPAHVPIPLYFGYDGDPSDGDMDYHGYEDSDTGPDCRWLSFGEMLGVSRSSCSVLTLPRGDLMSTTTVIALVFVLLGAGELLDPAK